MFRALALRLAAKVARKTALALRKMTDKLALGDDTGLENAWEEVLRQIQYEQSVLWDAYEIRSTPSYLPILRS
jgi:hypothetical protein